MGLSSFALGTFASLEGALGTWGAVAAVLVSCGLLYLVLRDAWLAYALRGLPQPFGYPFVGHVPYLLKEPWRRFYDYSKQLGSVYAIRIFGKPIVVVSDPALVKTIFQGPNASNYIKDQWSYERFRDVLGYGLVTSEGSTWQKHHQMLKPAFTFRALENLHGAFASAASRLCRKIDDAIARRQADATALVALSPPPSSASSNSSSPAAPPSAASTSFAPADEITSAGDGARAVLELSSTFRGVTLEVISEVALGIKSDGAQVFPALFETVLGELNERVLKPYRAWLPWIEAAHRRSVARLDAIVLEEIQRHRRERRARLEAAAEEKRAASAADAPPPPPSSSSSPGDDGEVAAASIFSHGGDMLSLMLDSGLELSDAQLSDEIKTQLLAGHETSSMMLTWSAYLLCRNPHAMARAVAEVDRALPPPGPGPGGAGSEPGSFEAYKGLSYLECVLKEAMRLFTPVPILNRQAQRADTIGKHAIPAKTTVMVCISSLHMDPALWGADVEDFRPERFEDEEAARRRHPWAYMPFSMGGRDCIGRRLAISEAKTVLGELLRRYTLALAPLHGDGAGQAHPAADAFVIPLRPAHRLSVVATARVRA